MVFWGLLYVGMVVTASASATSISDANFNTVETDNHAWLIYFRNGGKKSNEFENQWNDLTSSLKRLETGVVDLETDMGKTLLKKLNIPLMKVPFVALFKYVGAHESGNLQFEPIMEGSIPTTKILKKRLKRSLKNLDKDESGKFIRSADVPERTDWEMARASHILVKTENECQNLKEQIEAGELFTDVAKKHSSCPSRDKGGDLDWFGKGTMAAPFEQVCFYQKLNEVHGPVKTQFGWHLILITDRK